VILLSGAGLRVSYLAELRDAPDFDYPLLDAEYHDYWARGLAFGDWSTPPDKADPQIDETPFFRPPGYPYFLALVYRIFGSGYEWPRVVQFLLGLGNAWLAFLIGRRIFGTAAGLVTAGLMATYWSFLFFEGEFHTPPLLIALLLGLLYTLLRWRESNNWHWGAAAGLLMGLAAIVRPNALILAGAVLVWLVWLVKRRGWRFASMRTGLFGFLLVLVIAIAPVTIRNLAVSGQFVPLTCATGPNLWMGNNPTANGLCDGDLPGFGSFRTCYEWPGIKAAASRRAGHTLDDREASALLQREAVSHILQDPGHFLSLTFRRILLFWGPEIITHNKVIALERAHSTTLSRALVDFPLILAFALMALVSLGLLDRSSQRSGRGAVAAAGDGQRWEAAVLIALLILAWSLVIVVFFVAERYRVAIVPYLMLLAGWGVVHLVEIFRARRWRPAALWGSVTVGLFVIASLDLGGFEPNPARWHYDRAICHLAKKQSRGAIQELEQTLTLQPDHWRARVDAGSLLCMLGKAQAGVEQLREAVRLQPGSPRARYNLALGLELVGRRAEAMEQMREVLRLNPRFRGAAEALRAMEAADATEPNNHP